MAAKVELATGVKIPRTTERAPVLVDLAHAKPAVDEQDVRVGDCEVTLASDLHRALKKNYFNNWDFIRKRDIFLL